MKLSLVVASGVHTGKPIAINGPEFLIGRDEECHLRPASPAISKKHCAVVVRDGKIFVVDLGSTNGTVVNDVPVSGEIEVKQGDRLKVGPLDFTVTVTGSSGGTPMPESLKKPAAKGGSSPATKPVLAPKKPASKAEINLEPAAKKSPSKAEINLESINDAKKSPLPGSETKSEIMRDEADNMAAMMLGMDEPGESDPQIPDGGTQTDLPAVDAAKLKDGATKKETPMSQAESSSAASEILRKYMRRPK